MKALLSTVFDMSLTASWVILAVLVIRFLLRKAPRKYSYALWSVVAFRLCCPVSFSSALSLFNLPIAGSGIVYRQANTVAQTTQTPVQVIPNVSAPVTPAAPAAPTVPVTPQLPVTGGASSAISSAAPNIPITPAVTAPAADSTELWLTAAAVIWCVGMAALLIYAAVSYVRLRRQLATAVRMEGNIYQSDQVRSPFILGFLRPKIYIPFGLVADSLRYVIAHERTHLRRLDHMIKPLSFLLLTIHWFNPLVWLAFFLMSRDMEMSCDEAVLAHEDNIRKAYSTTLLSFAAGRRFPAPSPLAFGETGVKIRIRNVLSWKRPAAWVTAAALLICSVALIACAADPNETADNALPDPFGRSYRVTDILLRSDPAYRSHLYRLTEGCALEVNDGDGWVTIGKLTEASLSKDNFEAYITESQWNSDVTAEVMRQNLNAAWQLVTENDEMYLLLQTRTDERYLAYGYHDSGKDTTPKSNDSLFLWLVKLETLNESDETGCASISGSYLSARCIYIAPHSSDSDTGDSGYRYHITDGAAIITHRSSGDAVTLTPEKWGWQEFPWTDAEWEQLFVAAPVRSAPDISGYTEKRYLPLSDEYFLLQMDGTIWIAKVSPETESVWSIHSLKPEESGVLWEYQPELSSRYPAFGFTFDLPEGCQIEAYSRNPSLMVRNDSLGISSGQSQVRSFSSSAGTVLHWVPCNVVSDQPLYGADDIRLLIRTPDNQTLEATVCIQEIDSGSTHPTYSASITGSDLTLTHPADSLYAVIAPAEGIAIAETQAAVQIFSHGRVTTPYFLLSHSTEYVDGQWLSATGQAITPELLTELGSSMPAVILDRDFRMDHLRSITYGPIDFMLYNAEGRYMEEYRYYYGLTFLNWLEQGEYYLTFRIAQNGDYIAADDRYESIGWTGIVRIVVADKLAQPLPMGAKLELASAEMRINGVATAIGDKAALKQLEKLVSRTKNLPGGAGCPFGSVLYLTCTDGTVYSLCHSEDSCAAIFADGQYYRYSGGGEAFWQLFDPGNPTAPRPDTSEDAQLQLIADSVSLWALDPDYADDRTGYAVTDLDGNGRLEIIAANQGGTGNYTYATYYEVNEDCTALEKLLYTVPEGYSQPDIMDRGTIPVRWGQGVGNHIYIFQDTLRISASAYASSYHALTLRYGEVIVIPLATCETLYDENGSATERYTDGSGNPITKEEYDSTPVSHELFRNHVQLNGTIHWLRFSHGESILSLDADTLLSQLKESCDNSGIEEFLG